MIIENVYEWICFHLVLHFHFMNKHLGIEYLSFMLRIYMVIGNGQTGFRGLSFVSQLVKIMFSGSLPHCQKLVLKIFLNFRHLNWNVVIPFHLGMVSTIEHL